MARAKTVKKADTVVDVSAKKEKKEDKKTKPVILGEPREYSPVDSFEEGEFVYHRIWDDRGEVLETGTTEDGIRKMKVHFEKVGIKNLKMG